MSANDIITTWAYSLGAVVLGLMVYAVREWRG